MKYAIIENGVVTNVALADAPLADNWFETETAGTGWTFADGVFSPPPEPPAPPPKRILSKLEYMKRFTDEELVGIYSAAKVSVPMEIWLEKFKLASEINLDDADTISGLASLEAAGLLAAGRSTEIRA